MATVTMVWKSPYRRTQVDDLMPGLGPVRQVPRQPAALPVAGLARRLAVKIASSCSEWRQALELVADNYQARGYEDAGVSEYRFTSYHALPDTILIVAKEGDQVVATFTLVPDNRLLGLPMESIYRKELQQLRQTGRRMFETGSLADRGLSMREFLQVFPAMMRLGWQYQLSQGADTTVIAVNPRHRSYYTKVLGFLELGPWRAHPKVCGAPAEAYYIDPQLMLARAPSMHQYLFGEPLPAAALIAPRMPAALVRYFASHSSQTNVKFVAELLRYEAESGSPRNW